MDELMQAMAAAIKASPETLQAAVADYAAFRLYQAFAFILLAAICFAPMVGLFRWIRQTDDKGLFNRSEEEFVLGAAGIIILGIVGFAMLGFALSGFVAAMAPLGAVVSGLLGS